ncbi:WecB/TagA/CpsF family glycosyltransferase [Sulfurimonas sp. ST-25]|uniref:WecB/TagA/CpsF family glycosyltransferase n=1 Tax=Sulfurimonas sp. ST-25 TaxID=3400151 RepID=UPI003A8AE285
MRKVDNIYNLNLFDFENDAAAVEKILTDKCIKTVGFIYFSRFVDLDSDPNYLAALQHLDLVLLDGIGMQIYFKCLNGVSLSNLNGTDLMPKLIQAAYEQKCPISFYGTSQSSVEKCAEKHGSIDYYQDGFSPLNWDRVENNSMLIVGLGTPKQEKFVFDNREKISEKNLTVISVGGYFDFCSGVYKRAPKIIRDMKLEWLFRSLFSLAHARRYLKNFYIFYLPLKHWYYQRFKF